MKEAFVNAMVTALEGGSNYWCQGLNFYDAKGVQMSMEDWFDTGTSIRVCDDEDTWTTVTREVFFDQVKMYRPNWNRLEQYFSHGGWEKYFGDEDAQYDADDADQWLQLGIFGDVIFG